MISFLKSSIQITILPLENFMKYFILKRKYFSALFNIVRASYSYTKSKTLIFICRKKSKVLNPRQALMTDTNFKNEKKERQIEFHL